jgi:hypothetical protein
MSEYVAGHTTAAILFIKDISSSEAWRIVIIIIVIYQNIHLFRSKFRAGFFKTAE